MNEQLSNKIFTLPTDLTGAVYQQERLAQERGPRIKTRAQPEYVLLQSLLIGKGQTL